MQCVNRLSMKKLSYIQHQEIYIRYLHKTFWEINIHLNFHSFLCFWYCELILSCDTKWYCKLWSVMDMIMANDIMHSRYLDANPPPLPPPPTPPTPPPTPTHPPPPPPPTPTPHPTPPPSNNARKESRNGDIWVSYMSSKSGRSFSSQFIALCYILARSIESL